MWFILQKSLRTVAFGIFGDLLEKLRRKLKLVIFLGFRTLGLLWLNLQSLIIARAPSTLWRYVLPFQAQIGENKRWGNSSDFGVYSYFEKSCRKKCTRQSRKVLWVALRALFFKEIWKNGTGGHGHMFASMKESNKSRFDSFSRYEQCIDHIPYYLSGLSSAHFFCK